MGVEDTFLQIDGMDDDLVVMMDVVDTAVITLLIMYVVYHLIQEQVQMLVEDLQQA